MTTAGYSSQWDKVSLLISLTEIFEWMSFRDDYLRALRGRRFWSFSSTKILFDAYHLETGQSSTWLYLDLTLEMLGI